MAAPHLSVDSCCGEAGLGRHRQPDDALTAATLAAGCVMPYPRDGRLYPARGLRR